MLGRVVKTAYILRYAHVVGARRGQPSAQPAWRVRPRSWPAPLLREPGAFLQGDYEDIMNKSTALALFSNSVLVWNTVRIG